MTKTNDSKSGVLRDPEHSFDGIQEYDNDMPRWWVNLFIVTIIFSVIYLAWYHLPFFPSESIEASFAKSLEAHEQLKKEAAGNGQQPNAQGDGSAAAPVSYADLTKDAALVAEGKQVYDTNCVACHGPQGGGLVGPNLTDDFWIHDPQFESLYKVVMDGVAEKGMPPWGPVIGGAAAKAVLAYVATLRGTQPENAKAPEGTAQALP